MTQTTTYSPNLMQKLLGRNYKWWYAFCFHYKRVATFRISIFSLAFAELFNIFFLILLWQTNLQNQTLEQTQYIMTYFVLGYVFFTVTRNYVYNWLPGDIASGKIVSWLMYPQNIFKLIFIRGLGQLTIANLLSFAATAIVFVWKFEYLLVQKNLFYWLIFLLMAIFSIIIGILWNIIISAIAFWTAEFGGIITASNVFMRGMSGYFVPFYLLTGWNWLIYNPLAFTFYHPMQIYLGKYDTNQTIMVFLGGVTWCVILYFLAKFVFKMGLKRNESVGL